MTAEQTNNESDKGRRKTRRVSKVDSTEPHEPKEEFAFILSVMRRQ